MSHETVKVALVTGASSGIGRATALTLARKGYCIVAMARRTNHLTALVDEIESAGGTALAVAGDVSVYADAEDAITAAITAHGRLDVVVNAAGVMAIGPSSEQSIDQWNSMVSTNLTGVLNMTKAALPVLVKSVESSASQVTDIINISSLAGRSGKPGLAAYSASKWGVIGFSEAIRQEYASQHVRVSVLEPGPTKTEIFNTLGEAASEQFSNLSRSVELLEATDIAELISYLIDCPRRLSLSEVVIRPTALA